MVDYMAPAKRLKMAESSNNSDCELFVQNFTYEDAYEFYHKAATSYKIAKSWNEAGCTYIKLAECHLKMDSKHEIAATACLDAAQCYKKISPIKTIACLQQAVDLFSYIGKFSLAARHLKEMGELYEQLRDFKKAIVSFERAADFFHVEGVAISVSQCKHKIAQLSALLKQYAKAIEMFEEMAREAANSNLLRYGVRGHLLNAGLCRLCNGDLVAVTNALELYQEFDATFARTQEFALLVDLVGAYKEENVEKFTEILKDYDSLSPLGSWKTIILLRIKANLKAKDQDYDMKLI